MGLFQRKSSSKKSNGIKNKNKNKNDDDHDDMGDDDDEQFSDYGSVPKEVTTGSSGDSIGGHRCGSTSWHPWSKKKKKKSGANNNNSNNNNISNSGSKEIYYSSSTSSASDGGGGDDNIDGRQQQCHSSRRSSTSTGPPPTRQQGNTDQSFRVSQLQSKITERSSQEEDFLLKKNTSRCSVPPVAKVAAFVGPARFDWIDVEYNASTKIQSIFRRYLDLQELEERGMTTSYIRNRRRQRKAVGGGGGGMPLFHATTNGGGSSSNNNKVDESAPDAGFGCCSIGLAFGGDNGDGDDYYSDNENNHRNLERQKYQEKTREQAEQEEHLRQQYLQQHGYRDSVTRIAESVLPAELLKP